MILQILELRFLLKINTTNDTNDNIRKHIRLVDYTDNTKFGEIYFDYNDTSTTIKSTGSLNLISDNVNISLDGSTLISIGNDNIVIDFVSTLFNSNVELDSNSSLKFNSSAVQENNVMKSTNTAGTVTWGSITTVDIATAGGGLPIGSIIKIPLDTFISNFDISYVDNPDTVGDNLVQSELGKGLGDYSGWYVCNGVSWEVAGRERSELYGVNYWANNTSTPVFNNIPDLMGTFKHNGEICNEGNDYHKILGCGNVRVYTSHSNVYLKDLDYEDELNYWSHIGLGDSLFMTNLNFGDGLDDIAELNHLATHIGGDGIKDFKIGMEYVHIVYLGNTGLYQFLKP